MSRIELTFATQSDSTLTGDEKDGFDCKTMNRNNRYITSDLQMFENIGDSRTEFGDRNNKRCEAEC